MSVCVRVKCIRDSLGCVNTHKHAGVRGSVCLLSAFMSSYLMEIDLTAHPEV